MKKHAWIAVGLCVFALTRLLAAMYFEPHNDEALWVQMAQFIHRNWAAFHTLPYDGRMFGVFNNPLSFWLNSLTVGGAQPLWGARLWSVIFALVGLISGYRVAQRLWGVRVARLAAFFILCSSHFFYFDALAMPEVMAYSLGLVVLDLSTMACMAEGRRAAVLWAASGCAVSALLLSKETGKTFLPMTVLACWAVWAQKSPASRAALKRAIVGLSAALVFGFLVYRVILPPRYDAIREGNITKASAHNLVQASERGRLYRSPDFWKSQGQFLRTVTTFDWFPWVGLAALLMIRADRPARRRLALAAALAAMALLPTPILFKSHYARHWGMGLWAWFACLSVLVFEIRWPKIQRAVVIIMVGLGLFALARNVSDLLRWRQTDYAILETELGHYSGVGIHAMVQTLKRLPAGNLLYDGGWSHPGVDVDLFSMQYPQLKTFSLRTPNAASLSAQYFVFDGEAVKRGGYLKNIWEDPARCGRRETIERRYKNQTIADAAIYICLGGAL